MYCILVNFSRTRNRNLEIFFFHLYQLRFWCNLQYTVMLEFKLGGHVCGIKNKLASRPKLFSERALRKRKSEDVYVTFTKV